MGLMVSITSVSAFVPGDGVTEPRLKVLVTVLVSKWNDAHLMAHFRHEHDMVFGLYELVIIVVDTVLHYRAYYAAEGNATLTNRSRLRAIESYQSVVSEDALRSARTAFFVGNPATGRLGDPGACETHP